MRKYKTAREAEALMKLCLERAAQLMCGCTYDDVPMYGLQIHTAVIERAVAMLGAIESFEVTP
jgi:hypothetical protein